MLTPDHSLIKHRRNGSTIYRCPHHTHYLKTGTREQIAHEVDLYETVKTFGFPLPDLLGFELNDDSISWMKESIVPGILYAELFTHDCNTLYEISNDSYAGFVLYQKNHILHQLTTVQDRGLTANTIDTLWDKLIDENILGHELINKVIDKISDIVSMLPIVRNHGDHNPYNIFVSGGLIDLEDSIMGPLGYDTVTALTQNYWFPISQGELCQEHWFSSEQITSALQHCEELVPIWTDKATFTALLIIRGVFVTVDSNAFPTLQKFRYNKLEKLMKEFIHTSDCYEYFLNTYRTD